MQRIKLTGVPIGDLFLPFPIASSTLSSSRLFFLFLPLEREGTRETHKRIQYKKQTKRQEKESTTLRRGVKKRVDAASYREVIFPLWEFLFMIKSVRTRRGSVLSDRHIGEKKVDAGTAEGKICGFGVDTSDDSPSLSSLREKGNKRRNCGFGFSHPPSLSSLHLPPPPPPLQDILIVLIFLTFFCFLFLFS